MDKLKKIVVGCTCLLSGILLLGFSLIATMWNGWVDLRRLGDPGFGFVVFFVAALILAGIGFIYFGLSGKRILLKKENSEADIAPSNEPEPQSPEWP